MKRIYFFLVLVMFLTIYPGISQQPCNTRHTIKELDDGRYFCFKLKPQPSDIRHGIAAKQEDKYFGWPANNGIWQWGDEILVGFTRGEYERRPGHSIGGIQESLFSRSSDGGETWEIYKPDNFMDGENERWVPSEKKYLEKPIDFSHNGFAMRVFATGYHGNNDPQGGFYYSYDRGLTWQGPYYLGNINDHDELRGKSITARTDYIVTGEKELYLFISTSPPNQLSRIACIKTEDGGMSFEFVSWITPPDSDFSAIQSSTVRISENTFVLAHRAVYRDDRGLVRDENKNKIEVHISEDLGQTWRSLGDIKHFERRSNAPALVHLKDGRLVCIYGDRPNWVMAGRLSEDGGKSWGDEFFIDETFVRMHTDFGYPRLVQRSDGKLVALYYWATVENLQQHISVSIWTP